jgi:hypothetical protein
MLGATRVGEEAAAATVTAVIHAETEMVIITEVDDALVHVLAPLTAITALVMTESLVIDEIAESDETVTMDAVGMTNVGKISAKTASRSLPKTKEIAVLCLSNNWLPVSALASSKNSSKRLDPLMRPRSSKTVSAKDPRGKTYSILC